MKNAPSREVKAVKIRERFLVFFGFKMDQLEWLQEERSCVTGSDTLSQVKSHCFNILILNNEWIKVAMVSDLT